MVTSLSNVYAASFFVVKYQLRGKIICEESGKEIISEILDVAGGSVRGEKGSGVQVIYR